MSAQHAHKHWAVEIALSALLGFFPRFLGRCPRLELNRAVGAGLLVLMSAAAAKQAADMREQGFGGWCFRAYVSR
jgi:hypothetical protein